MTTTIIISLPTNHHLHNHQKPPTTTTSYELRSHLLCPTRGWSTPLPAFPFLTPRFSSPFKIKPARTAQILPTFHSLLSHHRFEQGFPLSQEDFHFPLAKEKKSVTMAKFYATATATVLFFIFTLTLARSPLKPLEKDDDTTSESQSLPPDHESSVFRLPTAEILNAEENHHSIEPDSLIVHSVPLDLTTTRFRPINRRFYSRTKYPVHNCRHHYHLNRDDFFKMNSVERKERLEIPYGDDMIVSSGENSDFEEPPTFRGVRRIPSGWTRLHDQHQHQDDDDDDSVTRIMLKRKIVDRLNKENKWKKHFGGENEKAKDEKKMKSNSLMKSMRKFLDHYF